MKVLAFGEVLWDVYEDKSIIGGAPLNFAAHLAKHGEEIYLLSALGKDELGKNAKSRMEEWGIRTDYIAITDDKQTGRCLVTIDENAIPSYNLLDDVAYDYIPCINTSTEFDAIYFGTLALRGENNFNSLKHLLETVSFKEVFVDVNIRPPFYSKETVLFAVKNATILKISLEELNVVSDLVGIQGFDDYCDFAKELANRFDNLRCIIITLGADGSYVLDCVNHKEYQCNSIATTVKSTVGAGDSFSATFLHKYLRRFNIQDCMEYASKIASFVVSEYDAVPDYSKLPQTDLT